MSNKVLVIGAGIAGINTALKLTEAGASVYLCEKSPYIGGMLFSLDKWFSDNHCGMCHSLPILDDINGTGFCLRKGLFHPDITVLVNTQVKAVSGKTGNFSVELITSATGVKAELCTGCGLCEETCPVENPKAIRCNNPLALKKTWVIDAARCTKCGLCVEKCPAHAIDLEMPEEIKTINVSSIIVSTGFEEYNAKEATAFGYGRYPNVLTNLEIESLLNKESSGDTLLRPSDGKIPESVAFLQCIGSRTQNRDYCSAVCCMFALKEAILLKQNNPETEITIYFMDIRDYGKAYHRYYEQARKEYGINFERCRIPVINQDFRNHDLLITHADESNKISTGRFDMAVLSIGQNPSSHFKELCRILDIKTDKWGFGVTGDYNSVATQREGIYLCGTASGPKDIADTVIESTAVASRVLTSIEEGIKPESDSLKAEKDTPVSEGQTKVVLCNCYGQLSRSLEIDRIIDYVKTLPGVAKITEVDSLCRLEIQQEVLDYLRENPGNSIILAGCNRIATGEYTNLPVEIIDIRENLAWVHRNEREAATDQVRQLIRIRLEKLKYIEIKSVSDTPVTQRVLVIGGGLAGMTAARRIADTGIDVDLIEKSDKAGGNTGKVHCLWDNKDFPSYVNTLVESVKSNSRIQLKLNTILSQLSGYPGNFKCTLQEKDTEPVEIEYGAVIVATGAKALHTDEYLYSTSDKVITQAELEDGLKGGSVIPADIKSLVMVQCVGSRDNERPYCSRVCCTKALKNALYLIEANPQIEITVFYRDLMSYGLREAYYSKAREKGVLFVRYEPERKPLVSLENNRLEINAIEPELNQELILHPDLVVLSPAIVPANKELAETLDVELEPDGFFREANVKFRPVDLERDGIYVCGLAHSPRDAKEIISQAEAVTQRVVALLRKGKLAAGHIVSTVNERKCSGCEKCVTVCPYRARIKDEERGVVKVLSAICRGCGICVAACPNGAAGLNNSGNKQIFSMIDTAV